MGYRLSRLVTADSMSSNRFWHHGKPEHESTGLRYPVRVAGSTKQFAATIPGSRASEIAQKCPYEILEKFNNIISAKISDEVGARSNGGVVA